MIVRCCSTTNESLESGTHNIARARVEAVVVAASRILRFAKIHGRAGELVQTSPTSSSENRSETIGVSLASSLVNVV